MSVLALRVRSVPCAALFGLVGLVVHANALAESGVLFAIPTEVQSAKPLAPHSPWHIALRAADLSALARVLNVPQPGPDAKVLDYVLDAYPEISGNSTRTWLESSFLIDYREREVTELYAAFKKAAAGSPWTREALVAFVAATMTGAVAHPFDVASQVARDRTGDCKAYAALTAALARSAGVPARVALGLVLVEVDGRYASFGHAWAETREANRWVVADAALGRQAATARYLPFGVLDDEGPGFGMSVIRLTPVWIQRVTIIGSP
jgi:hypothetical protein